MGLLKGTLTFSRYRIVGDSPDDFSAFVNKNIRKFAFQEFTSESEELSMGWTSIENVLDTQFEYANYALTEYLIFSLRVDKKNVPPSLLKIRSGEAEKAFLKERKQERLYKEQRRQILESVRLDLLSKALPIPAFFDICWRPSKNWLVFGSHSEKLNEQFVKLFERSFQQKLHPFCPWDKDYLSPEYAEAVAKEEVDPALLGRDFLTWLWFKSEERNGTITLEGEDLEIVFLRRIILESGNGEYTETVSCQGLHSEMAEGKAALRGGKKIKEAHIRLGRENSECEFSFKADTFEIRSLKMPQTVAQEEEMDKDGRTLERIYHLEKVMETIDRLFDAFLNRRFSGSWNQELTKMRKWVE
jgi:hypothetical protein